MGKEKWTFFAEAFQRLFGCPHHCAPQQHRTSTAPLRSQHLASRASDRPGFPGLKPPAVRVERRPPRGRSRAEFRDVRSRRRRWLRDGWRVPEQCSFRGRAEGWPRPSRRRHRPPRASSRVRRIDSRPRSLVRRQLARRSPEHSAAEAIRDGADHHRRIAASQQEPPSSPAELKPHREAASTGLTPTAWRRSRRGRAGAAKGPAPAS